MMEVIYQGEKNKDEKILITNKEFMEAKSFWKEKADYWCGRLKILLSARYKMVRMPKEDVGFEVFIESVDENTGKISKVFKRGGDYFIEETKYFDGEEKITRKKRVPLKEEEVKIFCPQEEYYEKQYDLPPRGEEKKLLEIS